MDETAEIIEPQEEEEAPQPKPKKPKAAKLSNPKPKKDTKKKKKKSAPKMTMSVEDIQSQIIGGHMMLSMFVPGATITEEAAMNEAVAIKRIIDIYGMELVIFREPANCHAQPRSSRFAEILKSLLIFRDENLVLSFQMSVLHQLRSEIFHRRSIVCDYHMLFGHRKRILHHRDQIREMRIVDDHVVVQP